MILVVILQSPLRKIKFYIFKLKYYKLLFIYLKTFTFKSMRDCKFSIKVRMLKEDCLAVHYLMARVLFLRKYYLWMLTQNHSIN